MPSMGLLEGGHIGAEFRQLEPERHLALEHARFYPIVPRGRALAGDDKNESGAVGLRPAQETQQRSMGFALGLAVEVEARIDRLDAAGAAPLLPALERFAPRRRFFR